MSLYVLLTFKDTFLQKIPSKASLLSFLIAQGSNIFKIYKIECMNNVLPVVSRSRNEDEAGASFENISAYSAKR